MKWNSVTLILALFIYLAFCSCSKEGMREDLPSVDDKEHYCTGDDCHTPSPDRKVIYKDGQIYLWGGHHPDWHFNVTNTSLDLNRLKFGLGREVFPALINPEFVPYHDAFNEYKDEQEMLVVYGQEETRVYPIDLLIKHEVINDVLDNHPIMVGYCVLADFPAVYSRRVCGHTFTYALSGYTYSEEGIWYGRDGFLLWDRDTESLWWPLLGGAVSGDMLGKAFNKDLPFSWARKTWKDLQADPKRLKILKAGQILEVPENFDRIEGNSLDCE